MEAATYIKRTAKMLSERFDVPEPRITYMIALQSAGVRMTSPVPLWLRGPTFLARQLRRGEDPPGTVMITSQRDDAVCTTCASADGIVLRFDEAVEHNPLPHTGCENEVCRCSYLAYLQEEDIDNPEMVIDRWSQMQR